MNSQTLVKSVWNRIRKIKGKDTSNTVYHLSVNDRDVTSHRGIASLIIPPLLSAQMPSHLFAKKLKSRQYFFLSDNAEIYSRLFSMEELQDALRRAHDTSAGPAEIHYQL